MDVADRTLSRAGSLLQRVCDLGGDRTTRLSYDGRKPNFRDKIQIMEKLIDTPRLPRKRRSLAQELVTVLSEQIRDGLLKRGDKLPTESAIMEAHGVSRTVVREAISRLQAAGQVETRHGIGTFVLDTPSPSGFRIDPATVVTL